MTPWSFYNLQVQMALGGPLGQLHRGVSDVVSEVEVISEEDGPRQRWTATSAELWPVRTAPCLQLCDAILQAPCSSAPSADERQCLGRLSALSFCSRSQMSTVCLTVFGRRSHTGS